MKTLNFEQMEKVEGGTPARRVIDGILCGVGIVTSVDFIGILLVAATCSLAFHDAMKNPN